MASPRRLSSISEITPVGVVDQETQQDGCTEEAARGEGEVFEKTCPQENQSQDDPHRLVTVDRETQQDGCTEAAARTKEDVSEKIYPQEDQSQDDPHRLAADIISPPFTLGPDSATFITLKSRKSSKRRFRPASQLWLKNSLLGAVGYLELANAGDFAANVWNQIPIPVYAIVFMAIGGLAALTMSFVAFVDARLSWQNLLFLQEERRRLRSSRPKSARSSSSDQEDEENGSMIDQVMLDTLLDVIRREMGTEIIDRVGMEIFLGGGALLVGIGTFMAIGGANPKVYMASNLLSGYIGNTPSAMYGLVNTAWSTFVWSRARHHHLMVTKRLGPDISNRLLKTRLHNVQMHAIVNGVTGLVAGIASIITATRWWGYVILAPCIVSAIWCNSYWRRKVGYMRPCFAPGDDMATRVNLTTLLAELETVSSAQRILGEKVSSTSDHTSIDHLFPSEAKSFTAIIHFIMQHDLFEDFSHRILQDSSLASSLFTNGDAESVTITSEFLLGVDGEFTLRILDIAKKCIAQLGPQRLLYRERYLLEILGCFLSSSSNLGIETESQDETLER